MVKRAELQWRPPQERDILLGPTMSRGGPNQSKPPHPMDHIDKNAGWPPLVARKIGAHHFQRWDNADSGSLGSRHVGKVLIDCKFRLAESQWGTLGTSNAPAGVIYIDLSFNQPKGHKLASASVQISLQEYDTSDASAKGKRKGKVSTAVASGLAVTDQFGPQMLTGKPTTQYGRSAYSLIPEVGAVVANLGGIGFSGEKEVVYLSQWVVEGHQISAPGDGGIYRTLEWKLSENDFTSQSHAHSSVVHTGLALKHEAKPFYIKVKIEGKLRKLTDRLTSQFVFPPRSRKEQGTAVTLLQLSSKHRHGVPLDSLARGLKDAMVQRNLHAVPRELPDSMPAISSEDFTTPTTPGSTGRSAKMDPPAPPPAYSSTQKPGDVERLSMALLTFADEPEEGTVGSFGNNYFPVSGLSKDVSKPQPVPNKVPETVVEDRARQLSAYPIVGALLHVLGRLLDLVEGVKGGRKHNM